MKQQRNSFHFVQNTRMNPADSLVPPRSPATPTPKWKWARTPHRVRLGNLSEVTRHLVWQITCKTLGIRNTLRVTRTRKSGFVPELEVHSPAREMGGWENAKEVLAV